MENKLISLEDMPEYRALRGAKVSDYRITAHRPEGKYNFSFSGSPIYDEKGKITMAIICCRDITRKVRSEEVINVQKEQLEKVLDNISEELYIWNSQGEYIMLNKHAQKRVDSWNTKNIFAILNERDFYDLSGNEVDKSTYSFSKIKDGKEIQDLIVATYDPFKKYLCINIKPILDINNNVNIGILTIEDITNDILYQQSVERQATLLYQIIYNLDLPLLRLSYPDFKIIDINQKEFIVLKELESKVNSIIDIKSKNINEVCPNFMDNENYQYIIKCAEEKKPSYLNNVKYIMNNKEKNFNLIFEPILALNGEVKEIIIIMIDITSEIKANLEMKSLLKLQDEFLANISHELKTPLNVIFSSAQLFNMYCKKGSLEENRPSMVKYLSSITQNCYRLSKLISNIVDASKIDAGFYELNKSNYNIVSVVEEIVMSVVDYSKSRALNIVFDTNVEEKIIAFDAEKIERVILNLLSNAIKFSNENDDIFVDIIDKGDFIEISVSDTGTGIDKHHLGIIFDRFKQADNSLVRNAQGSGIGLNLVKSIVDLHGGRIFVESEIGEGSRFTFILPAVLTQEDNNKANKKFNGNNQTISIELSDTLCM
ncbi:MAG: HAMP domain-containing histidine kinase [Clostridiaceae bacterium]|nr:HAMP domain-containing histidine kinase [Clostridiaceae bacterium]